MLSLVKTKTTAGLMDYKFLAATLGLAAFGLLMLSSASVVVGYERFNDPYYFLKQQLFTGVLVGGVLCWLLAHFDYRRLKSVAGIGLLVAIALLILVFIPGVGFSLKGASRWINIFGLSFQVSEVVKLAVVVYLAAWLDNRQQHLASWRTGVVPFLAAMGAIAFLIVLQPDIGTLAVVAAIFVGMYWLAGGSLKILALMAMGGLTALALLIKFEPYRLARLTVFLDPTVDPQGIGYHLNQALLAVGSGGWFGLGLGHSKQKFLYLPEVAGDSIFAVLAEELGFIVTTLFILIFLYTVYRGLKVAAAAGDNFGRLLVSGIIIWIAFQTIINIAAMVGLAPLTGIPLPFVSAGGTALAVLLAAVGLVLSVSRYGGKIR